MNKTKYHRPHSNPYKNANILKRLTFLYMFPVFYQTYRSGFTEENLFEAIDEHKSSILGNKVEKLWYEEYKISRKYALHKTLFRMFGAKTIITGLIKLIDEIALITIVPLSIGKLVSFFEADQTKLSQGDACTYAAFIGLTYFFVNLSFHPVMMTKMHISMKLRVCCTTLIYRKALKLSKSALARTTTGQIVNLLSNDVTKFEQGFDNTDYAVVAPIQTIVGLYILYREIGVSAVFGVLFLLSFVPLQIYVGKRTSGLRHKTAVRTDERVKVMNEVISGIQVIKMYCWEKPFSKLIALARRMEISVIRTHSFLMGVLYSFEMFLTRTSIFISLLSYVLMGKYITAEKVFLVTSIYSTIRPCVTILFALSLSNLAEINVSLRRINNFLCLDELAEVYTPFNERKIETEEEKPLNESLLANGGEKLRTIISLEENNSILTPNNHSLNARVVLKDVSAKWVAESSDNILENINISLISNQLMAVIGPVGSGKSSLISVVLRELQIVKGSLDVVGKISYASQEPWIFSGSIRENILFGEAYDRKRYAEVVRVCSLKSDFLLFPFGDKSLVGERGSALSGGQKARINLARCIYKKADIYLLDDPLSAVDANVGKSLYQDCIQLFLYDKIRILVTHQIQYLKSADMIMIMNNGSIVKCGRYEELQDCHINFAELFKEPPEEEDKKIFSRRTSRQSSLLQSIEDIEEEPEVIKETLTEGKIKMSTYYTYIRTGGSICMILLLVLNMLVARFFEYGGDFFLRTWVNMEQNSKNSNDTAEISRTQVIYIYSVLTVGTIVSSLIYCLSLVFFFTKASINLHNKVVGRLIQAPMNFFDHNSSGRILNRFSKDMGILDEYIPFILYDVIAVFVVLCGTVFISVFVKPWLLLPCVVLIIFLYIFRNFYIITSRNIKRVEGITRSPIYNHTNTTIYGLSTIRAFGAQNLMKHEFDAIQDRHSCAWFLFIASNRCFGYWLDIICVSFVMTVTYVLIFYSNNVYGGDVGLIFNQFVGLLSTLQWGIRQWSELENQMTSVERIIEYSKIEVEPERQINTQVPKTWPMFGKIEFKNLFLRYGSQEHPILKNLCFVIEPTQKIGIAGRTGAGKSSIISALFQLYELEGSIFIDGVDITKMHLTDVRTKISIIPQEPVLFSGTIRKNLDPFDEFSDDTLWNALEQVELKETMNNLENGLSSLISEGGSNFSVGQRQLACLARALIRQNKILVLDEATANVDPYTDTLIQKTIKNKFTNCTVLTIAHRLHTVMDSDKILLMNNGMVTDFDRPHVLLQRKSGLLHELVESTGNISSKNLRNIAEDAYLKTTTSNK